MEFGRFAGPKDHVPALSTFNSRGFGRSQSADVVRIGWVLSVAGGMPKQQEDV
jgi:hypothetical protein